MVRESLDNLIQLIEQYFQEEVWNNKPPLKDVDLQLVLLTFKIIKVRDNIDNQEDKVTPINDLLKYMATNFRTLTMSEEEALEFLNGSEPTRDIIITIFKKLDELSH